MTGFLKYFGIVAIFSAVNVTGIDFTISMDKVVIGNTGTLTMRCDVTENNVQSIFDIQIRRETTPGSNIFETLVLMELGDAESETPSLDDAITNNKDFIAAGTFDKTTATNTYLSVSMNISKMACNDAKAYRCDLTFKSISGSARTVGANGSFSAYVYPRIRLLEGRKNGFIVQGLSSDNQAEFAVGDELELSCTANIGSLPATTIRWRKTSEMGTTDEFIGYTPQAGSFDEGTAISDNQCGYTRTATFTYNTTVADANRENNLAFECYVSVSGNPYGATYTTQNNPKFYVEVSGGDQANEGGGDQENEGDRGISDKKEISDDKVTRRDLTAGAIGGVIGAVVILVIVIIVVFVRRKLITNDVPRTRQQIENRLSPIDTNEMRPPRSQPDATMTGQSSILGMYEHLQNTNTEMEKKNVYDYLNADSGGSTDSNAQYEKLQQGACSPPTYTELSTATMHKDGDRAYANIRTGKRH